MIQHNQNSIPTCKIRQFCAHQIFSIELTHLHRVRYKQRNSVNFMGRGTFCPKIYVWKINKMPEFYMTFAHELTKCPTFTRYCPKMPKFYDICWKNIFPFFFFWGGGKCSHTAMPMKSGMLTKLTKCQEFDDLTFLTLALPACIRHALDAVLLATTEAKSEHQAATLPDLCSSDTVARCWYMDPAGWRYT